MPSAREDYLIRLIQQVAAALRGLRERLQRASARAEATSPQELGAIGQEARDTIATLLGPQAPLLEHIDATSAVALVGVADRVALWIDLLDVQAAAVRAQGDAARAMKLQERVDALRRATAARWPDAPGPQPPA